MKLRIVYDRGPVSLVSDRGMVAEMLAGSDDARRRDAEEIKRAVNNHSELLDALKKSHADLLATNPQYRDSFQAIKTAETIARTEGVI